MFDTPKSLLERLQGDRQGPAWHRLVELYAPLMRGWLGRYHVTAADADDIVQEVLAAVVQDLPHFKHNGQTGAFRAWLRQITVNRLRSHWRGRQRQPCGNGQLLDQLSDANSELSRQWDEEHDRHVAGRLLELIAGDFQPATWQAFRRVVLEDAEPEAVAKELNLSINAVWSSKSRVLRRLRQEARGLLE